MKKLSMLIGSAVAAMTMTCSSNAFAASDVIGVWVNDTGRGAVEIKTCGKALCGHVVWVKDQNDKKGCGKQIIGDAQAVGDGVFDGGWIYSPEKKKNFDVELTPLSNGTLRVVGYMGTKLFSKTMIWTRAPAGLQRCGTIEAKAEQAPAQPSVAANDAVSAIKPEADKTTAPPSAITPDPATQAAPAAATDQVTASEKTAPSTAEAKPETVKPSVAAEPTDKSAAPVEKSVQATAEPSDDNDDGEKPGQRKKASGHKFANMKIGDLDLDKVFTKSKSGKCKIDTPWVKLTIDCKN